MPPGSNVTHLYGLTETYGPAVVNEWRGGLVGLPGRPNRPPEGTRPEVCGICRWKAFDRPLTGHDEACSRHDGETIGEVDVIRGNCGDDWLFHGIRRPTQRPLRIGGSIPGDLGVLHLMAISSLRTAPMIFIISAERSIFLHRTRERLHYIGTGESPCGVVADCA